MIDYLDKFGISCEKNQQLEANKIKVKADRRHLGRNLARVLDRHTVYDGEADMHVSLVFFHDPPYNVQGLCLY